MTYYVMGSDGHRYGPEGVGGLVQWAREGRLVASTVLIEAGSGRQLRAGELAELAAVLDPFQRVRVERGNRVGDPNRRDWRMPSPIPPYEVPGPKSKVAAALLALLLPGLGLHRFYLGFPGIAIFQILTTPLCGIGVAWGFVEGILCLTGHIRDADDRPLRD